MKLHEALQASKHREAEGHLPPSHPFHQRYRSQLLGIPVGYAPVAYANDGGVEMSVFDENGKVKDHIQVHWSQLLPHEMEFVQSLDWRPVEPKSPLKQLADALTDFTEDVEDEGNEGAV